MTTTARLFVILSLLGLTACNTAMGLGRDAYGGAKFVGKQVAGDDS